MRATFESYLKLIELNYKKSIIKLGSEFPWSITENWDRTFPFTTTSFDNHSQKKSSSYLRWYQY